MEKQVQQAVERVLEESLGQPEKIARVHPATGGCINNAAEIITSDGMHFFVKYNAFAPVDLFEREAEGLEAIRATGAVRAPKPLAVNAGANCSVGSPPLIIMEFISSEPARAEFPECLGRDLAAMHRAEQKQFGFAKDNHIGLSAQPNTACDSWIDFFRDQRLNHQLTLLDQRGYATTQLRSLYDRLIEKLGQRLGHDGLAPSLVHGDLWSGNIMADESGGPVLLDPAIYYGDREVDLAMTELFGRLDAKFYAAYREAYPLEPGYEDRRDIYNLYHLMNHMNLFGLSYMTGVMDVLRRYC